MTPLPALHLYHDEEAASAALNMALDEALLESATVPVLRFYRWQRPALSFGYFGRYNDVVGEANARDIVRRWTGGGIVLHGEDLTYSVILPRTSGPLPPSRVVFAEIHEGIRRALIREVPAALATSSAAKISESCFANPVTADVLVDGRKIAGAAQRRTRAGLLHQGSIQYKALPPDFRGAFAAALCPCPETKTLPIEVRIRAQELARQKYGTAEWLRRR